MIYRTGSTTTGTEICNFWETDFIHHQCWEVLPFCRFQHQWCLKILCPRDPDFYTPLALKTAKGQHLPAQVVHENQSPNFRAPSPLLFFEFFGIVQKVFSEKASAITRNASEMRQNGSCFIGKREERSKICVRITSKMRQECAEHLWGGGNTFWTIPNFLQLDLSPFSPGFCVN